MKIRTLSKPQLKEVKLFEAFAGIGSQYRSLENISKQKKWKIIVVGIIEWYINAIIIYVIIHSKKITHKKEKLISNFTLSSDSKTSLSKSSIDKINNTNIAFYINESKRKYNNLFNVEHISYFDIPINIDIFTYSFPCQDLSTQGLQKGISKKLKTRSGLLWKIENILKGMKKNLNSSQLPKYLLMENVKNLTSPKNLIYYNQWINSLKKLGYDSKSYILNSKDFNLPQNRERVFLISVRNDYKKKVNYNFPIFNKASNYVPLSKIVDKKYNKDLSLKNKTTEWKQTVNGIIKKEMLNYTTFNSENFIFNIHGIGPTLTASGANSRIKIEVADNKIRYLNACECLLYMGFNKKDYALIKSLDLIGDSKIIFLAGNSIPVNVLEEIFKSFIFNSDED